MDVTFFEQHPYYSKFAIQGENSAKKYLFWDNILTEVSISFEISTIPLTSGSNIFHQVAQTPSKYDNPLPQNKPLNNPSSTPDDPIELLTPLPKSHHIPHASNSEICVYSRSRKIEEGRENQTHLKQVQVVLYKAILRRSNKV